MSCSEITGEIIIRLKTWKTKTISWSNYLHKFVLFRVEVLFFFFHLYSTVFVCLMLWSDILTSLHSLDSSVLICNLLEIWRRGLNLRSVFDDILQCLGMFSIWNKRGLCQVMRNVFQNLWKLWWKKIDFLLFGMNRIGVCLSHELNKSFIEI